MRESGVQYRNSPCRIKKGGNPVRSVVDFFRCLSTFHIIFMSDQPKRGLSTIAIRGGYKNEPTTNACAVPIYLTSAYNFPSSEYATNLFALKEAGNIYTRLNNPTNDVLEQRLAELHGGSGALVLSSGQAATLTSVLNITRCGQNIVASKALYGGTVNLFAVTMARMGITTRFVDLQDLTALEAAIDDDTRLVFCETIGNPRNNVDDFEAIAAIAHSHGIPVISDNTVAPPPWFNPFEHGVDIVVYSLTKFISGHGTVLGGAIVDSGNFNWENGKFGEITEADPSYHGVKYVESFGNMAYIVKARAQLLRDMGNCLSPLNAFQIMQGMETLPLRLAAHGKNALTVAQWLEKHSNVLTVNYPGLPSHPDNANANKYLQNGFGGIIGITVKGGRQGSVQFMDSVKMLSHMTNLGDAKTVVTHPASTTHQQLTDQQLIDCGISEDFIRISVGIEDVEDIIADLDQALNSIQA